MLKQKNRLVNAAYDLDGLSVGWIASNRRMVVSGLYQSWGAAPY